MDDSRGLARRGGDPRRGHTPGAAARPHVWARAGCGEGDAAVTHLTSCLDAETVALRARDQIVRRLGEAVRRRGVAHLALSGGSSPTRAYELLAAAAADLADVQVWFADERCVGPEDEQSNYRLAAECLLEPAAIPPGQVHRMQGELGPADGARCYAEELRAHLARLEHGLPVLDLVVLGIGPDGHVASLFP